MHKPSASAASNQCLRLRVKTIARLGPSRIQLDTQELDIAGQTSEPHSGAKKNGSGGPNEGVGKSVRVIVEGLWTQLQFTDNAIIHLKDAQYSETDNQHTIDNSRGLLVLEPDNLITCTAVASTLFCERKAWLNHVFAGQVGTNRAMLVGTLVHEVFQHGVRHKQPNLDALIKHLDGLLDDATVMLEIYSVELRMSDVRAEALSYLTSVKEWIEKYMLAGPMQPLTNDQDLEVKITSVTDIEENVWSTKYGLKGKIDVTGTVRVHDKRARTTHEKKLPLELKTGNPNLSLSHSAQVSLYSMMIEDRYAETNQGLVIYLKNQAAMHNVSLTHATKRDLVLRRNQLNYHMKSYFFGPEMENQLRMCKNCERLTECILMSEMYDHDLDRFSTMMSLRQEAVGHLDGKFRSFFTKHHEKLVRMMSASNCTTASGSSFWTYTSAEAESRGTGFGKLQATSVKENVIRFRRHPAHPANFVRASETPARVTDDTSDGDDVCIVGGAVAPAKRADQRNGSQQPPSVKKMKIEDYFKPKKEVTEAECTAAATATGTNHERLEMRPFDTALNFARFRLAISLDEDKSSMDSQNSSTAISIGFMQELKEHEFTVKLYEGALDTGAGRTMFRVDRIEKRANVDIERMVLVRLLAREDWRCDRVRQLILEPDFEHKENVDLNLFLLSANFEEINELEESLQQPVVEAVSTDNHYLLTERCLPSRAKLNRVISSIVQVLRQLDRSVLIVAHNIDHLTDLMRTIQRKTKFILIDDGKSTKARFQFASNLVKVPQESSMDLDRKFEVYIRQHELAPVVMTTFGMSIGGLQFTRRTFDYCIVYDCDTVELLVGLSPLFISDKHILIDVRDGGGGGETKFEKKDESDVSLGDHLRALRTTSTNGDSGNGRQ